MIQNTLAEMLGAGAKAAPGTDQCLSRLLVPVVAGEQCAGLHRHGEPRARARVRRVRRAPAADHRRVDGRRAAERAALRRDAAPAEGDRRPRRRAGDHQRRAGGPGQQARRALDLRARRRQAARAVRLAGHQHRRLRHRGRRAPLPLPARARPAPQRARRADLAGRLAPDPQRAAAADQRGHGGPHGGARHGAGHHPRHRGEQAACCACRCSPTAAWSR